MSITLFTEQHINCVVGSSSFTVNNQNLPAVVGCSMVIIPDETFVTTTPFSFSLKNSGAILVAKMSIALIKTVRYEKDDDGDDEEEIVVGVNEVGC